MTDTMKNDNDFLGVLNLAAELQCGHGILRRYAEAKGVSDLMGGVPMTGKLGLRYPAASLNRWRQLMELHRRRAVTPQTAAAVLQILWDNNLPETRSNDTCESYGADLARIAAAVERIAVVQEQILAREQDRKKKKKG